MVSVISAAHCVYQGNKEDILILANSLANVIGKNKRFGETTHHVDEIRLHEDYARGKTKEVCNGGVACSLLKLGSMEKTVIASLFHSGLHSGTIFCEKNEAIHHVK